MIIVTYLIKEFIGIVHLRVCCGQTDSLKKAIPEKLVVDQG
jgi:hypothetical protein